MLCFGDERRATCGSFLKSVFGSGSYLRLNALVLVSAEGTQHGWPSLMRCRASILTSSSFETGPARANARKGQYAFCVMLVEVIRRGRWKPHTRVDSPIIHRQWLLRLVLDEGR